MDSLYHNLMQLKYLPYLPDELHAHACLELHSVKEVMSAPVVTLPLFGSVRSEEGGGGMMLGDGHKVSVLVRGRRMSVMMPMVLPRHLVVLVRTRLRLVPPVPLPPLLLPQHLSKA
jgi:hypothetical protein